MQKIIKSHISKTWITLRKTYKKIISMKKNYLLKGHAYALGALLLLGTAAPITSCKEVIDESNFAIKTEMTAADYIAQDERFSMIKALFEKIHQAEQRRGVDYLKNKYLKVPSEYVVTINKDTGFEREMLTLALDTE